ncbi:MAG: hypothetical protein NTV63_03000, partial [Candidatus Woesearchaeota archaeon]|nr:hypothetical protein [Candidatus Woesearchaeota archaeon]
MKIYLFSNALGSFSFDESISPLDSVEFSIEESLENSALLEKGALLESEKGIIRKHASEKVVILRSTSAALQKEIAASGFRNAEAAVEREALLKVLNLFRDKKFLEKFHSYSILIAKRKMRECVASDYFVMQAISAIDELTKCSNTLSKRLREWYELYNPETSRAIEDHNEFAGTILEKKKDELLSMLNVKPSETMGAELSGEDVDAILELARAVRAVFSQIDVQTKYLESVMQANYPKITEAAGAIVGARLIDIAGSIKHLAEMPSSKIQVLGAEKALFRHLRTGARPPKYGVISQHPSISLAGRDEKGKSARKLSSKIAMA